MAYGPGVNEINYTDLPPTGDTIASAAQKTQNQFDALYIGLNADIVRASAAEVNTAEDTTKIVTPGTLLKGKASGVASLNESGKVTGTELPDASDTVKGVVKVGSNISVADGVISVSDASTLVKGTIKVGTNLNVTDGVISVPNASETVKGVVELATPDEVLAGTDNERAVTPKGLSDWNKTPVGTIITYPVSSIPTHCLECNGATISRETYPELFSAIGTTYGAGDGSTTFKIPDFRDCFLRGANGTNAEAIGTAQGDAIRNITAGLFTNHSLGLFNTDGASGAITLNSDLRPTVPGTAGTYASGFNFDASLVVPTAVENRPVNFAVKFCIVYE